MKNAGNADHDLALFRCSLFACALLAISAPISARAQSCTAPPSGLLAWYTGDNTVNDDTTVHNPSATNAITFGAAKVGNGFAFGSGGFIDIPQVAGFAPQQFTFDAWVRSDGPGPNDDQYGSVIFGKDINRLSGVQASFILTYSSAGQFSVFVESALELFKSTKTYPPGSFYHVAVTYDGAAVKLYVNGVLDNQQPLTTTIEYDATVPYTIGANWSDFRNIGFARTWNGVIDELEFFGRALTAAEVQTIYDSSAAGQCKPPHIISPLTATATAGQQFIYQLLASDYPKTFSATPLPAGLTFDANLGIISGTPTQTAFDISLGATNTFGSGQATLHVTVNPQPSGPVIISSTAATGRVGTRFSFQVITQGGSPATRVTTTGLPPGLSIDSTTGVISGTATSEGSFAVTLTATNGSANSSSTVQLTFVSDPALPVITSSNTALLTRTQSFSYTIVTSAAVDQSDPVSYALFGTLPPGLNFDAKSGTISGNYTGKASMNTDAPEEKSLSGGIITNVQLVATNSHGTATTPLNFFLAPNGTVNISTRLAIGTAENVLIGGFIITGNAPKKVLLRAIGPSLAVNGQPVAGSLQDPVLELHDGSGALLGSDDDWQTAQQQEIIDTGIPPTDPRESAAIATLAPSNYTAIMRGKNDTTGIGLVEAYDLGTASVDTSSQARLAQISTRGFVQSGDNVMVGGFIVSGQPTKIIVRAIGPSLAAAGVANALPDPLLELHDGSGAVVTSNDDWATDPNASAVQQNGIAPSSPKESATYQVLATGAYTAIVRGHGTETGVALVEVYSLP